MNTPHLHELWDRLLPPERRWLALLVIAAAAAHAGLFAAVKVRQLSPSAARPPLLQTTALSVSGEQAWLNWRDPSAPLLPRDTPPLLSRPVPDYLPPAPPPPAAEKTLPEGVNLNTRLPSIVQQVRNTLTVFQPAPMEVQIETPPRLSGTVVELGGNLASREVVKKSELPQPEADNNLRVTVCWLAVNNSGEVENALVESSCGDTAIDQLAVRELQQWQFAPVTASGLQWGKAAVYWHFKGKPAPPPPAGGAP